LCPTGLYEWLRGQCSPSDQLSLAPAPFFASRERRRRQRRGLRQLPRRRPRAFGGQRLCARNSSRL